MPFWVGRRKLEKVRPPSAPPFSMTDEELAEIAFERLTEVLSIPMSGKEALVDFLSSSQYVSVINNLSTVFSTVSDYSKGRISEDRVHLELNKYYERIHQDAVEAVDEQFGNIDEKTAGLERRGVEPPTSALRTLRSPN